MNELTKMRNATGIKLSRLIFLKIIPSKIRLDEAILISQYMKCKLEDIYF